jgi:hypothetical protein
MPFDERRSRWLADALFVCGWHFYPAQESMKYPLKMCKKYTQGRNNYYGPVARISACRVLAIWVIGDHEGSDCLTLPWKLGNTF